MFNSFIKLPDRVEAILDRLERAGYASYVVGGAIRDLIRGIEPHDYDIATAAIPQEVMRVFENETVLPTGVQHGTVTLVIDQIPYEITTFRGEGAYTDHRRPDGVQFIDSVEDDLARRDFTVGAIAYSPTRGLCDPFGGVGDVKRGIIRAVGDPLTRFREDGLRVLRAIRFASVCGFAVEENTARALHEGKRYVRHVAMERWYDELTKTLCGVGVSGILDEFRDVIDEVLPEITRLSSFSHSATDHNQNLWSRTLSALEVIPSDPILRWTVLLRNIAYPANSSLAAQRSLARLKADRVTREEVAALIALCDIDLPRDRRGVHRLLMEHGKERILRLLAVKEADWTGKLSYANALEMKEVLSCFRKTVDSLLAEGAPLSVRDLAVGGADLISLGYRGREVGDALAYLLDATACGIPNEKSALLLALKARQN